MHNSTAGGVPIGSGKFLLPLCMPAKIEIVVLLKVKFFILP